MDALFAAPDRNTGLGRRDCTLLLFLYNSGARISEASNLPINKLYLRPNAMSHVEIFGKGGKTRRCPLWATTAGGYLALTRNRSSDEPVFVNRHGQAITRHGVHRLIGKYVRKAMDSCPSLANKYMRPHHPPNHRYAPTTCRRGHQHYSCMARSCLHRHHQHLCRGRSRTEGSDAGKDPTLSAPTLYLNGHGKRIHL